MDMVVKSVANKSKLKISIIQSIDRKMSLDDIADSKGLEMIDLLKEIESIVYSGTRVNIDYYIDEVPDVHPFDIQVHSYDTEGRDDFPSLVVTPHRFDNDFNCRACKSRWGLPWFYACSRSWS
jgi:ATP-dependent DNA helicase RecQ